MKHVILFHKDCTKFLIKHGMDATWLPHSAPSDSTVKGQVRVGRVWNGIALCTRQGPSSFVFTLSHIFTGIQGARRKEWAPALFSCIKKHQCPGLDTHCCYRCSGAQGLIVTD